MPDTTLSHLVETHISVIVMIADRVYKFKKPVAFDFIDMGLAQAREEACQDEVELNRRLAPDVYLGVGHFVMPNGDQEPAVVMRRLPAERCLATLLEEPDERLYAQLRELATTLRRFHLAAERGPRVDAQCTAAVVRHLWSQNIRELETLAAGLVDAGVLASVESLGLRFIDGRSALFESRSAAGETVDGHGDLLAGDVFLLDDGARVLDCLEFDPRLRCLDTLHDVCSLVMDMTEKGKPEVANFFLDRYAELCVEPWPSSLADFYVAHRAAVRAKVAIIEYRRTGEARFARHTRRLVELAYARVRAAQPRLVLVGGLPGTGKSTLAEILQRLTGWPILSSDLTRKRMAGLLPYADASAEFGTGIYDPGHTAATYEVMLSEAADLLRRGQSVILDASWIDAGCRTVAIDVAAECRAEPVQLRCVASRAVTRDRIMARRNRHEGASDATPVVAEAMEEAFDPWIDAIEIDTSGDICESVAIALDAIGMKA
jgi:aminoglycoside phosphotransferase family enzyme/predicted kinase